MVTVTISGPKSEANDVFQRLSRAYQPREVEIVAVSDATASGGADEEQNRVMCLSVRVP